MCVVISDYFEKGAKNLVFYSCFFSPKKMCIFYERCRKKRASRFHSCLVAKNGRRIVRYFLGGEHTLQMAGEFLMFFNVFFSDLNL